MSALLTSLGYAFLSIAPIAQIIKTLHTKNTSSVALFWPLLMLAGMLLVVPGVLDSKSTVLIWGHFSTVATNTVNLILIFFYRKPRTIN